MKSNISYFDFVREIEDNKKETLQEHGDEVSRIHEDYLDETEKILQKWNIFLMQNEMEGEHSILTMRILQYLFTDLQVILTNLISGLYHQTYREL